MRKTVVYKGVGKNGEILHIGITTQKPEDRFRTHEKRHEIDKFIIIKECDSVEDALYLEKKLIVKYKPRLSVRLKQNDNRKKSTEEVNKRIDSSWWCQRCLKRRVNKGYKFCRWC